ncbi:2-phospho-L-lactate guanylyltransferase [Cupriavidus sp. 8B]
MEVIVPIKRFSLGKQRLADRVCPDLRRELCRLMAEWVMRELARTLSVRRVTIVTAEPALLPTIRGYGYDLLLEHPTASDLNGSVSAALERIAVGGAQDACVVHSDLPLFTTEALQRVIEAHQAGRPRQISLVSDRFGHGTNVRLCRPVSAVGCAYGRSSAYHHELAARDSGVAFRRLSSATLSLDLDTYEDIACVLRAIEEVPLSRIPPVVSLLSSLALGVS